MKKSTEKVWRETRRGRKDRNNVKERIDE